jgi:hypothetical protein
MLIFLYRLSTLRGHTMPTQVIPHLFWRITLLGLASPTAAALAALVPWPHIFSLPTLSIAQFGLTSRMHHRLVSITGLYDLNRTPSTSITH